MKERYSKEALLNWQQVLKKLLYQVQITSYQTLISKYDIARTLCK